MPESRHKYLYERLGDHDFQLLVSALLTARFEGFVPMALRQSDGGRDGLVTNAPQGSAPAERLVYQVKWSADGREKDPVTWLSAVVASEETNLRRFAEEGVRRYVLVTNVPSTAKPGQGTFDKLNVELDKFAKKFGFEQMTALWREALDGMVDNAPTEIKWQYADMLAGWDLIRYLISDEAAARAEGGLRALLRKVAATQWDDDERVKFSQVDIDREKVADLFVDVTADRLLRRTAGRSSEQDTEPVGGAAAHLLNSDHRCVLVRGAPGQGKSTLSQYVSQAYRTAFIPAAQRPDGLPSVNFPLFPLRADLSDYAQWLSGADVWERNASRSTRTVRRSASQSTVECFLADLMTYASGGLEVTPQLVQDILERVPTIIVLDGLDEVGRPATRKKVVDAIEQFCRRGRAYTTPPRVVVTTRPSTEALPEPSPEVFDLLVLNSLDRAQRDDYLRKWCEVRGIRGSEGKALRSSFRDKSKEPYIGELAGNPMQLTILLDLLHKHGEATPTQRTELYDSYVDLLLAREANKHPDSVRKHQKQLREIVPFLGWYLQARSEASAVNAQMSVADLKATIRHFQRAYGKQETVVDELFEAASFRLWALTSKIQGSFEFEVLSLREYFAARFLYRYAGEDTAGFDRNTVFRELLRRPYWLNTARFYGGNAEGEAVYVLAEGVRDELADNSSPSSVVAAWTLLTDGVFASRPRKARDVLGYLCADHNLDILLDALGRREIVALPELPRLPSSDGDDPTWIRLTAAMAANPADPANLRRVRVLRDLLGQRAAFAAWWAQQVLAADTAGRDAWLKMAASCEGAAGAELDLDGLDLSRPLTARRVLDTGLIPTSKGRFEADLIQAVLDGQCPDVDSLRSLPAQIAVAFGIQGLLTTSPSGFTEADTRLNRRRREAVSRLRKADSPFAGIAELRRFRVGEKGSTFPWANMASGLFGLVGRCWLASLTAIVGAASPNRLAFTRPTEPTTAFGPDSHPATLLAQSRTNAANPQWWRDQLHLVDTYADNSGKPIAAGDLSRAEWVLALWCVGHPKVLTLLFDDWKAEFIRLPLGRRYAVADAAKRIGSYGWLDSLTDLAAEPDRVIGALLAHRGRGRPGSPTSLPQKAYVSTPTPSTVPPPLLDVARTDTWFKVDTIGVYR